MPYNVLKEPWIPVRRTDGTVTEMGILDVLRCSPELLEITDTYPNYEYGMYRLLFVFLMDAYHPQSEYDLLDLLDEGSFDEDRIQEYVTECNKDGERFDLFDKTYPFLQRGINEWPDDSSLCTVAKLNPAFPSGNNHVHFDHRFEGQINMTYAEASKALCALNIFCTLGGRGYQPTISSTGGVLPIYTIIKGNNLFQTLVYNMFPRNNCVLPYDDLPPLWRITSLDIEKKLINIPLLFGLLYPVIYVRLREDNGLVTRVDYKSGLSVAKERNWIDPYVSYRFNGKKQQFEAVAADIESEIWQNLSTMIECVDNDNFGRVPAPLILKAYRHEETNIHLVLYATYTEKGKATYDDMQRCEYVFPYAVIPPGIQHSTFQNCLDFIQVQKDNVLEAALGSLQDKIQSITGKKSEIESKRKRTVFASERKRTINRYFFRCRQSFFDNLCPKIASHNGNDLLEVQKAWVKEIRHICWAEYDAFVTRIGDDSRLLIAAEVIKRRYFPKGEEK